MFIILKTDYCQLWVLYESVLRIYAAGNHEKLSELNVFIFRKTTTFFTIIIRLWRTQYIVFAFRKSRNRNPNQIYISVVLKLMLYVITKIQITYVYIFSLLASLHFGDPDVIKSFSLKSFFFSLADAPEIGFDRVPVLSTPKYHSRVSGDFEICLQ